jgi:hypothetical protein
MKDIPFVLRVLIVTQMFLLFAFLFLPTLLRFLNEPLGKVLYAVLVVICIGLALALRRALEALEDR